MPIAEEIKSAILLHEGRCGQLYDLVLSYEQADWEKITNYAEELGIPAHTLTNVYFNCTESVNATWKQIISPQQPPMPEVAQ